MLKPDNLEIFLATPAIWTPGMNSEEWNYELDLMLQRSHATRDFVDGKLTPDQFENAMHELRVGDVIEAAQTWNDGKCYL